jgi:hypothetical protein
MLEWCERNRIQGFPGSFHSFSPIDWIQGSFAVELPAGWARVSHVAVRDGGWAIKLVFPRRGDNPGRGTGARLLPVSGFPIVRD